jgi:hypothetical protein
MYGADGASDTLKTVRVLKMSYGDAADADSTSMMLNKAVVTRTEIRVATNRFRICTP